MPPTKIYLIRKVFKVALMGVRNAIQAVLGTADVPRESVTSVIRLCGPFCREVSPFADFPSRLKRVIEGCTGYVDGGLESTSVVY